jgi:hypothetical protein
MNTDEHEWLERTPWLRRKEKYKNCVIMMAASHEKNRNCCANGSMRACLSACPLLTMCQQSISARKFWRGAMAAADGLSEHTPEAKYAKEVEVKSGLAVHFIVCPFWCAYCTDCERP